MSMAMEITRAILLSAAILLVVYVFCCLPIGRIYSKPNATGPPKLLLISYDGFRWDYLSHATTPNIRYLISNGVTARFGLKNTFITITAPNHYGIVTGLYEESHGIVANNFYDPILNKTFNYFDEGNKTDPRFFRGSPIWVLNEAAAPDRRTGCVMWVGCDIKIGGNPLPNFQIPWTNDASKLMKWQDRVDKIISWFIDPTSPINLGILYIEEPDETGHKYGPHDPRTLDVVKNVDQLTGYLLWCLTREGLLDQVNIIMTADHGMADVPVSGGLIDVSKILKKEWYDVYGGGPNWNIRPKPGHEKDVLGALNGMAHVQVYTNDTIPKDYHYANTPGVMRVQLESDLHYMFMYKYSEDGLLRDQNGQLLGATSTIGAHGYNNSLSEMHPYFVAHGPAFEKGFAVDTFMNLDLYPLMAHILGVHPAPNNASFERVRPLLACNERFFGVFNSAGTDLVGLTLIFIMISFLIFVTWMYKRARERQSRELAQRRIFTPSTHADTTVCQITTDKQHDGVHDNDMKLLI